MDPETEYLPPRQFARLIGISESTLAKQRMRGDGPTYVKVGRAVRYARGAGLAWMAAHTRRSTSEEVDHKASRKRPRGRTI
jgi:predicted DNA-binding transcriptional regulator AlpA